MTGEKSRTLRRKIVVIFLLIGLVPLFAASVPSFLLSQKALKRAIGLAQRDLAVEVMDKVDREIDNARLLVRNWISIPEILEIVIAGGQRLKNTRVLCVLALKNANLPKYVRLHIENQSDDTPADGGNVISQNQP